jgi:hypothetical protein
MKSPNRVTTVLAIKFHESVEFDYSWEVTLSKQVCAGIYEQQSLPSGLH